MTQILPEDCVLMIQSDMLNCLKGCKLILNKQAFPLQRTPEPHTGVVLPMPTGFSNKPQVCSLLSPSFTLQEEQFSFPNLAMKKMWPGLHERPVLHPVRSRGRVKTR